MDGIHSPIQTSPPTDDICRLKACPACDYSLAGLPLEGVCPECGRRYDQSFIILTGRGRGRFDDLASGTWRGVLIYASGLLALIWIIWSKTYLASDPTIILLLLLLMIGGVLDLSARFMSPRVSQMQVWMNEKGIAQVPSTSEARRAKKLVREFFCFSMILVLAGVWLLGHRGIVGLIILGVTIIGILIAWQQIRRRYRLRDEGAFVPRLWPWERIINVDARELSNGNTRLRCIRQRYWKRTHVNDVPAVDLELQCSPDDARRLEEHILDHISHAQYILKHLKKAEKGNHAH